MAQRSFFTKILTVSVLASLAGFAVACTGSDEEIPDVDLESSQTPATAPRPVPTMQPTPSPKRPVCADQGRDCHVYVFSNQEGRNVCKDGKVNCHENETTAYCRLSSGVETFGYLGRCPREPADTR